MTLTNGHVALRTAVLEQTIDVGGDYAGWEVTLRVNPPVRVLDDLRSGDTERFRSALGTVIRAWNFVDDEGAPLPLPRDGLDWAILPYDLEVLVVQRYGDILTARVAVPKATSTPSAPVSPNGT